MDNIIPLHSSCDNTGITSQMTTREKVLQVLRNRAFLGATSHNIQQILNQTKPTTVRTALSALKKAGDIRQDQDGKYFLNTPSLQAQQDRAQELGRKFSLQDLTLDELLDAMEWLLDDYERVLADNKLLFEQLSKMRPLGERAYSHHQRYLNNQRKKEDN